MKELEIEDKRDFLHLSPRLGRVDQRRTTFCLVSLLGAAFIPADVLTEHFHTFVASQLDIGRRHRFDTLYM